MRKSNWLNQKVSLCIFQSIQGASPVSGYLHSQASTNQSPWLLPSSVTSADPEEENARGTALWWPTSKCITGQGNSQWLSNCQNPNVCLKKGSVHVTHISEWRLSMICWCSVMSASSSFRRPILPGQFSTSGLYQFSIFCFWSCLVITATITLWVGFRQVDA